MEQVPLPPPEPISPPEHLDAKTVSYEDYKRISEQKKLDRETAEQRDRDISQMRESGELLEYDHPLYTSLYDIVETLDPGTSVDLQISLSDIVEAHIYRDFKTITVSYGLVHSLNTFLEKKGKTVQKGHLAFILAHELSHRDPEGKVFHLNEKYADTQGLLMAGEHFSTEDIQDTLEFLEYAQNPNEHASRTQTRLPITHPSSEDRRITGQIIINDPKIHLPGRTIESEAFPQEVMEDFIERARSLQRKKEEYLFLKSEENGYEKLAEAETLSQVAEAVYGINDHFVARLTKSYGDSEDFSNAVLSAGVVNQMARPEFRSEDFYYGLLAEGVEDPLTPAEAPSVFGFNTATQFKTMERRAMEGSFGDGWQRLVGRPEDVDVYPQLKGVDFNSFYRNLIYAVQQFVDQRDKQDDFGTETKTVDKQRMATFAFEEFSFDADDYAIDDNTQDVEEVMERREKLLSKMKYVFSAAMVRRAADFDGNTGLGEDRWPENAALPEIVRQLSKFTGTHADYSRLHGAVIHVLQDKKIIESDEVANDLSLLLTSGGRFIYSNQLKGQWRGDSSFQAVRRFQQNEAILRDWKTLTEPGSIVISRGTTRLGGTVPTGGSARFANSLQKYFDYIGAERDHLRGNEIFDPYIQFVKGDVYVVYMAHKESPVSLGQSFQTHYRHEDRLPFGTTDKAVHKQIALHRVNRDTRNMGSDEILAQLYYSNKHVDIQLAAEILEEGTAQYLLTPEQIKTILSGCKDMALYRKYLPYLGNTLGMEFYDSWVTDELTKAEASGEPAIDVLSRFITEGGVVVLDNFAKYNQQKDRERAVRSGTHSPETEIGIKGSLICFFVDEHARGMDKKPPSISFSKEDATQLSNTIVTYVQSENCIHDDNRNDELLGVAAKLQMYSMGIETGVKRKSLREALHEQYQSTMTSTLGEHPSYEVVEALYTEMNAEHVLTGTQKDPAVLVQQLAEYKANKDFITLLTQLPVCSFRDALIIQRIENYSHAQDRMELLTHLSPARYAAYNFDDNGEGLRQRLSRSRMSGIGVVAVPLTARSADVAETYSFVSSGDAIGTLLFTGDKKKKDDFGFLSEENPSGHEPLLTEVRDMLLSEKAKPGQTHEGILERCAALVPVPSAMRDYLIESVFFDELYGDEGKNMTREVRLDFLEKAIGFAYSQRTIGLLATEVVRLSLQDQHYDEFRPALDMVVRMLPHATTSRDEIITQLLNSRFTTWDQIREGQGLVLGYSQRTDRGDAVVRNFSNEVISLGIEKMQPAERQMLVTFLFSKDEHITHADELSDTFFTPSVRENMTKLILKTDDMLQEQEIKDNWDTIQQYVINKSKGNPVDQGAMSPYLVGALDKLNFPKVAGCATPERMNKFFKDFYSKEDMAINSFGPLFFQMESTDRRQLVYHLCLGDNGVFEDSHFQKYGSAMLTSILDRVTRESGGAWSAGEADTVREVVMTFFEEMPPMMRTETFARVVDLYAHKRGEVTKEELVLIGLSAFRAVGAKLGQMDQLWPADLRQSLSVLKEDIPPIPKATTAQILIEEGRDSVYEGLGPYVAGGSIGCVIGGRRTGTDTIDRYIKMQRPDVIANTQADLEVVSRVLQKLHAKGVLKANPQHLMGELSVLIQEELSTRTEHINTRIVRVTRRNGPSRISVPEIAYTGKRHLEMEIAPGISLRSLKELKKHAAAHEDIPEELQKYLDLDITEISGHIVSDFFYQAFTHGVFHADEHGGNVFIDQTENRQGAAPEVLVSVIDHGQVGLEDDPERRHSLFTFTLGMLMNKASITAAGLHAFMPTVSMMEIQRRLHTSEDMYTAVTELIAEHGADGSITRYIKAFINVAEHIQTMNKDKIVTMLLPYAPSRKFLFDMVKATPFELREQLQHVRKNPS